MKSLRSKSKINIAITIGQIKDYKKRKNIFKKIKELGFKLPKIISKHQNIYIEKLKINSMVKSYLDEILIQQPGDLTPHIDMIRMI